MFSFVLIGTSKGSAQHFTLTQHVPSPQRSTGILAATARSPSALACWEAPATFRPEKSPEPSGRGVVPNRWLGTPPQNQRL